MRGFYLDVKLNISISEYGGVEKNSNIFNQFGNENNTYIYRNE